MQHTTERGKGTSKSRQPKTVLFINDAVGPTGERPPPPEIASAIDYGRRMGWDMIATAYWRGQIPEGVRPDGMIALCHHSYKKLVQTWHSRVKLGVVIDAPYVGRGTGPYPVVKADGRMVGHKAAEYFAGRGFRNFAIAHYDGETFSSVIDEFREHVREIGGVCNSIICGVPEADTLESQTRSVKQQLAAQPLPLAIFCVSDNTALRMCRWCLELGLSVPEQVAILGRGNDLMACECGPVPLSSVELAPGQMGSEAARLLHEMMEGGKPPDDIVLVPVGGIVTRRSTDILAISDPDVAHALRYMWDNYSKDIGIEDIAAACGISGRKLIQHFRASLNRTVIQELTRFRLKKACELLSTSDFPIIDISAMTGYRSPQHFNERFKQHFNVTPMQYRVRDRKKRRLAEAR